MAVSLLLVLWVGLRRPLAFGHPVPLRVQFDDWIREHSALEGADRAHPRFCQSGGQKRRALGLADANLSTFTDRQVSVPDLGHRGLTR